ncbi:PDZ domain-containing protein [Novipirellula artificiosorum]|uniref:Periplasmic serine endoprotease DegP n=1 Tax=Novipirellula artificiosorum TaxID=2528016 RepID=A0A5C6DV04_9BACT|nr:PDZ domain-containing protein [Novipirellula artificiosorum]TWU40520.1 Periplasmic serine endoprotease DegP precursor [Novipirellula artificiosorum]
MIHQRSPSLILAMTVGFVTFFATDSAHAQLFPRLRARLNGSSYRPGAPYREPAQRPMPSNGSLNSGRNSADRTLRSMRPAQPVSPNRADLPQSDAEADELLGKSILDRGDTTDSAVGNVSIGVDVKSSSAQPGGLPEGLIVSRISDQSLADEAGLRVGDLIISLDGQPTANVAAVRGVLDQKKPGDRVVARVIRGQESGNLSLPLVEQLAETPAASETLKKSVAAQPRGDMSAARLGIEVENGQNIRGAVVSHVKPGSAGESLGLRTSDRIVSIDDEFIASGEQFLNKLSDWNSQEPLEIQLIRDEKLYTMSLDLTAAKPFAPNGEKAAAASIAGSGEMPLDSATEKSSGKSVLGGIGSALGGLFGGMGGDTKEPSAVETATPRVTEPSVQQLPQQEPTAIATEEDDLALGDDEPIGQLGFEDLRAPVPVPIEPQPRDFE